MNKNKYRIALIFGGEGEEREISLAGARFVCPLINREKYEVVPTFITKRGEWLVLPDTETLEEFAIGSPASLTGLSGGGFIGDFGFLKIDCAIPLLHGSFGEDGRIQGALECAHIPYVGSDVSAGAVAMDKAFTKTLVASLGIPTVPSHLAIRGSSAHSKDAAQKRAEMDFGYPMFIKPARQGSSVGASVVQNKEEFDKAFFEAVNVSDGRVLLEQYIDNRVELECAYLAAKGKQLFTPLGEISCDGFYDYDEKYAEGSTAKVLSVSSYENAYGDKVREWSKQIVEHLGVRHLSRLDFFLSGDRLYFNEINTFPGFTEASLYPRLIARLGISPEELIDLLISDSLGI